MSGPWEQFAAPAPDDSGEPQPWERFRATPPKEVTALSRAKAGATGINKGFWTDLLGLPVDTATNIVDLGKAAIGYGTSKVTGKPPPDWTTPYDRSQVPGSAEWLAQGLNKVGMGDAINNPNPEDQLSRVLHMGGRVAGQSVVPVRSAPISLGQNAANMAKGAVGGIAAGSAGEVAPEWAGVAGMLPQVLMAGGAGAVKRIVRGDEAGRQAMAQRLQDLQNGGIAEPSVGLASGNRSIMGLENLLAQTPGSFGLYDKARINNMAGMQGKSNQLRDSISPEFGPMVAGEAIQSSIKGPFVDRFKSTQKNLYDAVDNRIPGGTKTPVKNTATTLERLTSTIEGAPNIGDRFINGRISDINDAFRLDTGLEFPSGPLRSTGISTAAIPGRDASSVSRTVNAGSAMPGEGARRLDAAMRNPGGQPPRQSGVSMAPMRTTEITTPGMPAIPGVSVNRTINPNVSVAGEGAWRPNAEPSLPYTAVSKLRSQVGQELDGNMLMSDVPRSQWKQLYGGLSEDIGNAATAAGPQAQGAWERANNYTKKGIGRIEDLESLANRSTPEGAYTSVANSLDAGSTVYKRLRGALTPESRQKLVATVVNDLGTATPGQQNATGDAWSPRTFLTNYNRMDAGARTELFKRIPGGERMSDNLADIAKAADMVGDASKIWSNPSGTAPALTARATAGALTIGAFLHPVVAASTAGGLVLANQTSQRLLLNPKFVDWLAKAKEVRPEQAQAYSQRLIANARMTNDKQFQQDVAEYLNSVEQSN